MKKSKAEVQANELLEGGFEDEDAASSRHDILQMLDRREKDAEELELESCFSELRSKVGDAEEDIESLANQSLTDLREM